MGSELRLWFGGDFDGFGLWEVDMLRVWVTGVTLAYAFLMNFAI
jgi:hypothetical protein